MDVESHPGRSAWIWSVAIAALVLTASLSGLIGESAYDEETTNWATQARGQDIGNLLAVITLLVSGHRMRKGSHRAALVWLGTLLYLVYAYVLYAMAVHFNQLFLVYVAALGLSAYAVMFSLDRLRAADLVVAAPGASRLAGYTSITIGVVFAGLWLSELVPATLSDEVPQSVADAGLWVNPVHVIDLAVVLPAMVIAGIMTLRGRAAGLFFVGPLLVFSVLMGASIVVTMVLMALDGSGDTLVPLVMVSLVVLASAFAAWRHLQRCTGVRRKSSRVTRTSGSFVL